MRYVERTCIVLVRDEREAGFSAPRGETCEISLRMECILHQTLRGYLRDILEKRRCKRERVTDRRSTSKNHLSEEPDEAARGGLEPDDRTGHHGRPRHLTVLGVRGGIGNDDSGTDNGIQCVERSLHTCSSLHAVSVKHTKDVMMLAVAFGCVLRLCSLVYVAATTSDDRHKSMTTVEF